MNIRLVALAIWLGLVASANGQGQIDLNNRGLALVKDATGKPLTGSNYVAQVWYGADFNSLAKSFSPAPFRPSTTVFPGTWNPAATGGPGSIATLDGFDRGSTVILRVAVWDLAKYSNWQQAKGNPNTGLSDPFIYKVPIALDTIPGGMEDFKGLTLTSSGAYVGVQLELVPKITITGSPGGPASVEFSTDISGPWTTWSNLVVSADGVVLVDLSPGSTRRFYRAVAQSKPTGPDGFVWIAPGSFLMGSPITEADRYVDEVQHMVTLTQGFWLSDHEVTQGEFEAVMGSNPSWHKGDSNRPVEKVTWESAVLYCQKLTERDRAAGRNTSQQEYRLPTEAEWEYAARAGTTGSRYGNLDEIGWYSGNSGLGPHPVKQKSPNAWGLYDMIGNVWEWCSDRWDDYPTGSAIDPSGPITGTSHVFRGGSWGNGARFSRSASRWGSDSCFLCLRNDLGFRPAFGQVR